MITESKEKAKLLLIKRINDFKPESESMERVLSEVIDDIWNLFGNELITADQTINCKGIQYNGKTT